MTTYHLRSASPAKTRSDVVVVGALQSGKDVRLAAGAEDVAEAYGRKLRPLLSTLGFTGKPGEVLKLPTAGTISSPLLLIVGLGKDPGHVSVRRAAGAAARAISNASSVALALPADSPTLVRAVIEGFDLGGYTFTAYKRNGSKDSTAKGANTVSLLTGIARQQGAVTAMEDALVVAQAVRDTRDWVNLPAADLRPPEFADAVAGAAKKLGLPVKVSTFAPMAENMVSGSAMRPGDVITQYGGTTVEVLNTDAEGRLILADALVRATELGPDVILDVATLTGHMVIALGDRVAGVLGSDDIVGSVLAAGEEAGEAMRPMPIPEAIVDRVKASQIADLLQHDGVRWGGGLFAAAYLREFTADLPWAHLDIAGTAFNSGSAYGHITSGGTGASVTTLVEYARSLTGS